MIDTSTALNTRATILCVVGARPNFMKMAPIISALNNLASKPVVHLLHTGQHYDVAMNSQYFDALGIPDPDTNLDVGSGSHAVQTAEVMLRFEPVLDKLNPSIVLVVGDVNSTLACALVSAKKGIPLAHVEAGLRSSDRSMPEELNRILTDQLSDLLFTTESSGQVNLLREGIQSDRIHFVGNVMIDSLLGNLDRAVSIAHILETVDQPTFTAQHDQYVLLTMHRSANVDNPEILGAFLEAIKKISTRIPVVFPVHPRTKAMIEKFQFTKLLQSSEILLLPPMGYLEMLGLMKGARIVLTDSGGIQEETTALGIPCITLRNNTERPITVSEGTNTIAGQDPVEILKIFEEIMKTGGKTGRSPELWDGKASTRIAKVLEKWLISNRSV